MAEPAAVSEIQGEAWNSTDLYRDKLADGILSVLKPTVIQLDEKIKATRTSQILLRSSIDNLRHISEQYPAPFELDPYVKKLQEAKKRIAIVSSILQNAQERLHKLHHNIAKETAKRKANNDSPPQPPP